MGFENIRTVVTRSNLLTLAILCYVLIPNIDFADGRRLHKFGKRKGTIKTIESDDGDVIDCVDIYKQPAFDHPLLKNHTIEASSLEINRVLKGENDEALKELQGWRRNGECPEGTVPIVRTPTSAIYGPKTHFKSHYYYTSSLFNQSNDLVISANQGHEYAEVAMVGGPYFGAKARINVWNPDPHGTISISQIWVVSSHKNYDQLNSVEAGWITGRGDSRTRFFIYWTSDGYRSTGCYNHDCPGFVQVSRMAALGGILKPISTYNGVQKVINVFLNQHKESGQWWVQYQNEPIGYWPNSIFTTLKNGADLLSWGGEIVNNGINHHTETQMGSGHFPAEGFGRASFFSNIEYIDSSRLLRDPNKFITYATKPSCYDVKVAIDNSALGAHFFYGGPGYSDKCRI